MNVLAAMARRLPAIEELGHGIVPVARRISQRAYSQQAGRRAVGHAVHDRQPAGKPRGLHRPFDFSDLVLGRLRGATHRGISAVFAQNDPAALVPTFRFVKHIEKDSGALVLSPATSPQIYKQRLACDERSRAAKHLALRPPASTTSPTRKNIGVHKIPAIKGLIDMLR